MKTKCIKLSQCTPDIRLHVKTEDDDGMFGTCPNCDQSVPKFTTTVEPTKFCPHCGQALKWDE